MYIFTTYKIYECCRQSIHLYRKVYIRMFGFWVKTERHIKSLFIVATRATYAFFIYEKSLNAYFRVKGSFLQKSCAYLHISNIYIYSYIYIFFRFITIFKSMSSFILACVCVLYRDERENRFKMNILPLQTAPHKHNVMHLYISFNIYLCVHNIWIRCGNHERLHKKMILF